MISIPKSERGPALLSLLFLALFSGLAFAQPKKQPRELGAVAWERDFAVATKRAEKLGRPLLLLFQEVPG